MNKEMLKTLRDVTFLRGFATKQLRALAEMAEMLDLPEGKTIFHQGEPALHVFFIEAGNVSLKICVPARGCTCIHTVRDGELFGFSAVVGEMRRTATARTLTATRAIQLRGDKVLKLCEQDPDFGYEFMRRAALTVAQRLNGTRLQLLDLLSKTVGK